MEITKDFIKHGCPLPFTPQQPLQEGTDPDPYVKLYLLPDPQKTSKRKTKVAHRTCNPTYNEMVRKTMLVILFHDYYFS